MAYTICFLVALAIVVFFLVYGLTHMTSEKYYFNCNKQLGWFEFGNSFAAATTSLATVLLFFVILGLDYGLLILWSPITFIFGTVLFNHSMLPKLKEQGFITRESDQNSAGNTLGAYIKNRYDSKTVSVFIMLITLLGIFSILLIELFVGVQIFRVFLKPEYEETALYIIAFVTFIYTGVGGLNAVVKTDKIQFWFMATVAIVIVLYYANVINSSNELSLTVNDFLPSRDMLPSRDFNHIFNIEFLALFINMFAVNILLIPSLLRNWQLISASKNEKEIKKGFTRGAGLTVGISFLFVVFGILFFKCNNNCEASMIGILGTMAESNSPLVSYILFPALFGACLMALLSTVDSSLLPVVQCLRYDILPNYKNKFYKNWSNPLLIIVTLVLTLFLYKVVFKILEFDIVNWLFTIFSLVTISSPAIFFACFGKENLLRTKAMRCSVIVSTILGLALALWISIHGNELGNTWFVQLNTPWAIIVVSLLLFISYWIISMNLKKSNKS